MTLSDSPSLASTRAPREIGRGNRPAKMVAGPIHIKFKNSLFKRTVLS